MGTPRVSEAITIMSRGLDQTLAIGKAVAALAQPGDAIALIGELGAGKTQFVRGLAEGLHIAPEVVSSPTFVIMHEYEAEHQPPGLVGVCGRAPSLLVHIDAYRLAGPDELNDLALEDVRVEALLAVEWADRVMPALGEHVLEVEISHAAEGRVLNLTPRGRWLDKIGVTDLGS